MTSKEPVDLSLEEVFQVNLIRAEAGLRNIMTNFRSGFVLEMLPLDLAYGSYAVALERVMVEIHDAWEAALKLKQAAE